MIVRSGAFQDDTYLYLVTHVMQNARAIDIKESECSKSSFLDHLSTTEAMINNAVFFQEGAFVCLNDRGVSVAVGGIAAAQHGTGNAWLISTDEFDSHKLELIRFVKKLVSGFLKNDGHRVQCITAGFHSNALEWLESCGFKKEGELVKYGSNGESFYQFGITR